MATVQVRKRRFRRGDRVRFTLGLRAVEGWVREDRGPIGIKGRRLYLVEFGNGEADGESQSSSQIELPAEELQPVSGGAVAS